MAQMITNIQYIQVPWEKYAQGTYQDICKKILKKMLFLDIDHAGIGGMLSQKNLFVSSYNMRGF